MGTKTWIGIGLILVFIVLPIVGYTMHWIGGATTVVTKEIEPSVIQEKYVGFQKLKAAIDGSDANIKTMINAAIAKKPSGNRSTWDRTDKQEYTSSIDDITGNVAHRNGLIEQYNGDMGQWQKGFANLGTWPKGSKTQEDFQNDFPGSYPEYGYGEELKALLN